MSGGDLVWRGLPGFMLLGIRRMPVMTLSLVWCVSCGTADNALEEASGLSEVCLAAGQEGACIFSEGVDCDSKDFFRGGWDFSGTLAYGECYAPEGVLPVDSQGSCSVDLDCTHGQWCDAGQCNPVHNYFCSERVEERTTFGCNGGVTPECNTDKQTCRDEWFACAPAQQVKWPDLGSTCEDIIVTYEIVAEQVDDSSSLAFCSKRHEGCSEATDCSGPSRPSADHCGPTEPGIDAEGNQYDCVHGDNPTPPCPDSDDPSWPSGLGASADLDFIERAERVVGELCAVASCSGVARCRPVQGGLGYTDGGLGIQGSSGIKDDSFIGHARVCRGPGVEVCDDTQRTVSWSGIGPCLGGLYEDDTRDALVPGSVSRREVDIRCQCVSVSD